MNRTPAFKPLLALQPATVSGHPIPPALGEGQMLFSIGRTPKKPTIRVERRRPVGPAGGPKERAEAPLRRRPSQEGAPPPPPPQDYSGGYSEPPSSGSSGPSMPSFPSGGLPRNIPRSWLLIGLAVMVCLFVVVPMLTGGQDFGSLLGGGDQSALEQPAQEAAAPSQPQAALPTAASVVRPPAGSTAGGDTWLVMLYQDADDKILEKDIYVDLNEAERVGSTSQVHIVAQIDRYNAGYQGDGDWTSARRYYVTQDDDLDRVSSQMLDELGEVNMADPNTLVDFVTWAMAAYPADKYALILSDHGMGWPGGWSDPTATGRGGASFPLANVLGDVLYLNELDQALQAIRSQTGLDAFELLGMDACLMGQAEILTMLTPHARYAVISEETEPALGWAYAAFLSDLTANPAMSGAELSRAIVETYVKDDQRILDDQARAEMAGGGSPLLSLFGAASAPTADQVARQMIQNASLTAADLSQVPALLDSLNNFAFTLQSADQRSIAQARSYSQSFTSIFGKDVPPSYIDLGNFAQQVEQSSQERGVAAAASQLQTAINNVVIAEMHGARLPGATGIAIYFPNSQLYGSAAAGAESYTAVAERFAAASLWDDFLAFHYTGQRFQAAAGSVAVPPRSNISAPAAGGISATPINLSSSEAAPGQPVLLSTDVSGENIGYIRLLVGYLDTANNSLFIADSDYLQSPQTRQLNGVYYPDWTAGQFTLEFEWEPILLYMSDGTSSTLALFSPETYGAAPEEAVYSVEGIYHFADGSESRYARLYFQNGILQQVFGFTGDASTGAPREIIPQTGDSFTVLQQWMDLDAEGNVIETVQQDGDTLTFGETMFYWEQVYAPAGEYVIGIIIEDLDGNQTAVYTQVTVR